MTAENSVVTQTVDTKTVSRNYQLDFLRLFFSFWVFMIHARIFIGENTRFKLPGQSGGIAVFFFFVVSGMLMTESILKQAPNKATAGKNAMGFILNKFKKIAWQYWAAAILVIPIYMNIGDGNIIVGIYRSITELLLLSQTGLNNDIYNGPTWYLSAMFISMLPLAYLLYKKSDFTLYVFAPLTSVMVLGYICQISEYGFISQIEFSKFVMGGILRAISGLCFGITAWAICRKIKTAKINKNSRILLTVAEAVLYLIFLFGWFNLYDRKALMAIVIILPIALAVTFSGKSYICRLFRFKWMRVFAPLSLSIYLNHRGAVMLTEHFFMGKSFKFCVAMMALFTAIFCLLNYAMVKLGKMLWNRKLKEFFTKTDNL